MDEQTMIGQDLVQTMKKAISILAVAVLAVTTGCGGGKQSSNDFITVDVTKSYSSKKELILQDFMDVEYVALETNDDFLNQGFVMDIGKEIILVRNYIDDGDIFIYDRNGKALRKINRRGQKISEEYTNIYSITLDEDSGEMFVYNISERKLLVYDLYGKFKRSFSFPRDHTFPDIYNYDKDNLICFDFIDENEPFILISKQNGSLTKGITIPFKEKKRLMQMQDGIFVGPAAYRSIIVNKNNWLLSDLSTDTMYAFLPDYSLRPFLVRTPAIQSMDPEVMVIRLLSDRYCFMETIINEYNFVSRRGFDRNFFMYDRQEKTFSGYTVYNGDYSTKKEIYMIALRPVNHEIESWMKIEAYELVADYKAGRLKEGKLKEIASKLDEEDNPVIMLVKHKK